MYTYEKRRRSLIRLLYYRHFDTCENLVRELDVTVRTIYADIAVLTYFYPLEVTRGRNGGVRLADEFIRDHKVMRPEQAELIDSIRSQLKGRELLVFDSIFSQFDLYD